MPEIRAIGLEYIKIGDVGAGGGMGDTLAAIGQTYKDTAELVQADPEVTEFYVEEADDPVEELTTKGVSELRWGVIDMTPANMVKVLGGTVSGTAPNDSWNAPSVTPEIEQSIEVKDKKTGRVMQFPRCKIRAKIDWKLARTGIAIVSVVAKILVPTDGTTAPIIWKPGA